MSKDYQKTTARVGTDAEFVLPEAVTVAMAEIGGAVREGLLALAVATGLQVMTTMMEESVTALAEPKGRHQPDRAAVRHGTEAGSVAVGGRRVPVRRPRVRAVDGSGELAVEAYEAFSGSDLLGEIALERMMAKLSTRRYRAGLEPVGAEVEARATSTSKSSVSRRFVARTETALAELMAADLNNGDVVAVMIDGVHFAGHC
jgi:putative transposase